VTFCKLTLVYSAVENQEIAVLNSIDPFESETETADALRPIRECATSGNPTKHHDSAAEALQREDDLQHTLRRAFFVALLLAANAEAAESAVLEAIQLWNSADEPAEALFRKAVRAVLNRPIQRSCQGDIFEAAASLLPASLRGILRLPPLVRQCYVLRLLVGFSQQSVARLLDLSADEVSQHMCVAVQRLAGFRVAYA
jgi:DNA-directed RNA polymerase specialized sigma24 family protein